MANIKDLFNAGNYTKNLVSKSLNDMDPGVESANYAESSIELTNRVEPYVDFSNLEEFVFYGSAEQYYRDSYDYIEKEFPYDGSGKEKIDWELQGSPFDNYVFQNEYPRTNGYITIGKNSTWSSGNSHGYFIPSRNEYIYFEGGPHPAPEIAEGDSIKKFFPSRENATPGSNYYNSSINQQSNLEIDGTRGITLEFWLNKESYVAASESPRQVICDLWNSGSWGTDGYGRFRVEVSGSPGDSSMLPKFHVELLSGTAGFSSENISLPNPTSTLTAQTLTGSWNHFALAFQNNGSEMQGLLYQNGNLVDKTNDGTSINLITGSMIGQIGSLITQVSGASGQRSYGLLSASLDEFRFWKNKRTATQIGQNWFTQVDGGTNTDFEDKNNAPTKYSLTRLVDLGMYYKFNEGITGLGTIDSKVLDYSGRITNGKWNAYGTELNQRSNNSAIVEAGAATSEFKDPILYSYHPSVVSTLTELTNKGVEYDVNNNASIYQSIPGWIRDEDIVNNGKTLLKLTQVISSYFDQLQLQIKNLPRLKDVSYISSSQKPLPFINRLVKSTGLTTHDLFSEASQIEELSSRDDFRLFSEKLSDTKNRIYQNIYNNITHIFKSKGTEKSFKNLIRCYGIGDELVKLNLYGDEVTYDIKENFNSTITRKKYANFYNTSSFGASVYQSASATDTGARSYLSASSTVGSFGHTFQAEVFFPKTQTQANLNKNFLVPFTVSSIFGLHTVKQNDNPDDLEWASPDLANFQTSVVKTEAFGKDAYFMLTGTAGGSIPLLTSSIIKDVYDNSSWNLAVRLKPSTNPWAPQVTGSTASDFDVEFLGYNTILDSVENSFKVTGSISYADGTNFLTYSKRAFVGAHRTNFTSSVLQKSDVRISSVRFWRDYLDDKTILAHAKDPSNYGRYHPGQNSFVNQIPASYFGNATPIPQIETLALQWNFDQVTGSNASGEFVVEDYSSGSISDSNNYGWIGNESRIRHPGKAIGFANSSQDAIKREYVYTAKQLPPETLNSSDMIEIKNEGDIEIFTKDTRPVKYFFAVEKSMNSIISEEMVNLFATIMDFNNLIGEPVNRYRQDYKSLGKMRELFFRKVQNSTMDFEKFFDYYKWVDDSITSMLTQIFPVSANFSDRIFTTIESHVLERNKYWNKFPTLEFKKQDPQAGLFGINEMLYPYKYGSAPIPNSLTGSNCTWWLERADRENINITSSNTTVNAQRNDIKNAKDFKPDINPPTLTDIGQSSPTQYQGSTFAIRNFTKPYRFVADEMITVHGGSNFPNSKKPGYTRASLKLQSNEQLEIDSTDLEAEKNCNDIIDPSEKNKLHYKLKNSTDENGYISGKGNLLAPFSLYSSSVSTGYATDIDASFGKLEVNNYHSDIYASDKGTPLQGPFTERHVGGLQYRHVNVNTSSLDTTLNRPEVWDLSTDTSTIVISSRHEHRPRATMLRDESAKRPVNIRNIKWGTGSQAVGNYRLDYEPVQTSGRTLNNRFFVKNSGFEPQAIASVYIENRVDYILPDFNKFDSNKSIFVERFNAPGGPEVSSRGSMNVFGEEYSVYNGLNYRNLIVREPINDWLSESCGQFGIKYGYTPSLLNYDRPACYHKVNRNPITVGAYVNSNSTAVTTSVNYDNWFIQHAIPRSDLQYKWINDSYNRAFLDADYDSTKMQPFGHVGSPNDGRTNFTIPSGSTSANAPGIQFVTASEIYESSRDADGVSRRFGGVDFVGLNTWVYDPLTSSVNTLSSSNGIYSNTAMFLADLNQADLTGALLVNALNLHRNGPYQYPSWKQIRTGESPMARYQKRNNILTIGPNRQPVDKINLQRQVQLNQLPLGYRDEQTISIMHTFIEPMVTFKYKPLDTTYKTGYNFLVGDGTTRYQNTVRHAFCNNLYFFANSSNLLAGGFNLPPWTYPQPQGGSNQLRPLQIHDAIYNQYNEPSTNIRFVNLEYKEIIFPKEVNTGLNKTRSRVNYEEVANVVEKDVGFGIQEFAVLSDGPNGIDRNSRKRRTFWNNTW